MKRADSKNIMEHVLDSASKSATEAEVFRLEEKHSSVNFQNAQLHQMNDSESIGLGLRMIKDGKLAFVSTSNMSNLENLTSGALALIPFCEPVSFSFPSQPEIHDMFTADSERMAFDRMVDVVQHNIDTLRKLTSKQFIVTGGVDQTETHISLINSKGLDLSYSISTYSSFIMAVHVQEKNILTVSSFYIGRKKPLDTGHLAKKIAYFMEIATHNVPFSGERIPVIFTPHAFADILATLGTGISGNSVSKGTSPLKDKLGEKILDERITIIDDPLHEDGIESNPFDDEGVPSRVKPIVESGVLRHFALDLRSASRLNLPSTGNGFRLKALINERSYNASPTPKLTNVVIPPGDRPHTSILKDIPRCVLIDQLTGIHLGNLINGDWSANVELGVLYENGEPRGRVKNAMTGGNFYEMFNKDFVEFSSDREWATSFGSGSSSNYLPYVLIDGVNISAR